MDLMDLRYLSITVETGSLLHAAQSLGVKPSTISSRITGSRMSSASRSSNEDPSEFASLQPAVTSWSRSGEVSTQSIT